MKMLMSDYEVTLVNDNSKICLLPPLMSCLQHKLTDLSRQCSSTPSSPTLLLSWRFETRLTSSQARILREIQGPRRESVLPSPLAISPELTDGPAPFHGGLWKIHVELPDQYPYKSPSIGFVNRIFHPNIDELSGSVCLDVINQTWSPMYDMVNIFEVFLPQLLRYPNPTDPLNGEAAALMMRDEKGYNAKVKGMSSSRRSQASDCELTSFRVRSEIRVQGERGRRGRQLQ